MAPRPEWAGEKPRRQRKSGKNGKRKGNEDGLGYFCFGSHCLGHGGLLRSGILDLLRDRGFVVHSPSSGFLKEEERTGPWRGLRKLGGRVWSIRYNFSRAWGNTTFGSVLSDHKKKRKEQVTANEIRNCGRKSSVKGWCSSPF